ncbi:MAG: YCF48-related protein [Ignavibacteriae bacterium]|nr:YCF48-related protein [Ignavibacteriota bacterium]
MKKKYFIILIAAFAFQVNISSAQSSWYWEHPTPQGNMITSSKFFNTNTGFCVGFNRTLLKTTNGGINWQIVPLTIIRLNSINVINSQTGFIAAYSGTIFKTTNTGENWVAISSPSHSNYNFKDIYFLNDNTGYCINDSYIFKTTNGGMNWNTNYSSSLMLTRIYFKNQTTGFVIGKSGMIAGTTNSGSSWFIRSAVSAGNFTDIAFANDMRGFITGESGDLISTTDGGVTWPIFQYIGSHLYGIDFADQNTGSLCGYTSTGSIIHTTDGGDNWTIQTPLHETIAEIVHISPTVILSFSDRGQIYRTTNEGTIWDTITKGINTEILHLCFVDSLIGFATFYNGVTRTTDGGAHWIKLYAPVLNMADDIKFINRNTGFVIGGYSYMTLCKTTDGGTNWVKISNGNPLGCFKSFHVFSQDTMVCVGGNSASCNNNGNIYRTNNGGSNWNHLSYTGPTLNNVSFNNSTTGYACGNSGTLLRSTDRGNNWSAIPSGTTYDLTRIKFVDSLTGWICGGFSTILKTTNGGLDWFSQMPNGWNNTLRSINFLNHNTGIAVGSNEYIWDSTIVYITSNGGTNWVYVPNISANILNDVAYPSNHKVTAAGSNGTIISSYALGNSLPLPPALISPYNNAYQINFNPLFDWSDISNAESYDIQISKSSSFDTLVYSSTISGSSGLQLGSCVLYRNSICYWRVRGINSLGPGAWSLVFRFSTHNYSNSWTQQLIPDTLSNNSVFMSDTITGWIAGNKGRIFKTTSGGDCWFLQTSLTPKNLNTVFFRNTLTGWAAGDSGVFLRTNNGGASWNNISLNAETKINSMYFISIDSGWIAGNNGKLYRTFNSGQNWIEINPELSSNINCVIFVNSSTGWICGNNGKIYKTSDGGTGWTLQTINTTNKLNSIAFVSDLTGWVAGQGGIVYKTTDGGTNWFIQNSRVTDNLNSVFFTSPDRGWLASENGKLIATKSSGNDWRVQTTFNQKNIKSISFTNINNGWICGSSGSVYYSPNGSIITLIGQNTELIPDNYSLSQNYPNPFNPVTRIRYALPRSGSVRLAVYDVMGREVDMLVNERQTTGSYEAVWDGTRFASGVYFYRLTAEGYGETKPMLLIK